MFKINDTSKEVQKMFFELGYKWVGEERDHLWVSPCGAIWANSKYMLMYGGAIRSADEYKEITKQELQKMVNEKKSLISGEEAKKAWANGEAIELRMGNTVWDDDVDRYSCGVFSNPAFEFRIKPKTITINGIEVPAPFKPKEGELYWFITDCEEGYGSAQNTEITRVGIAAWRTEDEVKQVIAALKSIFNA